MIIVYGFNPYYSGWWLVSAVYCHVREPSKLGFNPYYSGWWLVSFKWSKRHYWTIMFQSLLFWMMISKEVLDGFIVTDENSFNPYYSGWWLVSPSKRAVAFSWILFQSLLFWMMISKSQTSQTYLKTESVSILIILDDD